MLTVRIKVKKVLLCIQEETICQVLILENVDLMSGQYQHLMLLIS
jgi:hypothetical protein